MKNIQKVRIAIIKEILSSAGRCATDLVISHTATRSNLGLVDMSLTITTNQILAHYPNRQGTPWRWEDCIVDLADPDCIRLASDAVRKTLHKGLVEYERAGRI